MGVQQGVIISLGDISVSTTTVPNDTITAGSIFGTKKILTTATLVNAAITDLPSRRSVNITNNSLNSIYISNINTVTKDTGLLVAAGATVSVNVDPTVPTPLYAVSIGVASNVSIMEV